MSYRPSLKYVFIFLYTFSIFIVSGISEKNASLYSGFKNLIKILPCLCYKEYEAITYRYRNTIVNDETDMKKWHSLTFAEAIQNKVYHLKQQVVFQIKFTL